MRINRSLYIGSTIYRPIVAFIAVLLSLIIVFTLAFVASDIVNADDDTVPSIPKKAEELGEKASDLGEEIKDKAEDAKDTVVDKAHRLGDNIREKQEEVSDWVEKKKRD